LEDYIKDPHKIEERSFEMIREVTDLSGFTDIQQQVVMRLVHTSGNPEVAQQVRISDNAINAGIDALNQNQAVLCDVEMVKQGLTKRFLTQQPLCFLNHEDTPKIASANGETRTMSALEQWKCSKLAQLNLRSSSACRLASSVRQNRRTTCGIIIRI
jgi:precorrin-8X/cobalt-precorrin-8 methylmutase